MSEDERLRERSQERLQEDLDGLLHSLEAAAPTPRLRTAFDAELEQLDASDASPAGMQRQAALRALLIAASVLAVSYGAIWVLTSGDTASEAEPGFALRVDATSPLAYERLLAVSVDRVDDAPQRLTSRLARDPHPAVQLALVERLATTPVPQSPALDVETVGAWSDTTTWVARLLLPREQAVATTFEERASLRELFDLSTVSIDF